MPTDERGQRLGVDPVTGSYRPVGRLSAWEDHAASALVDWVEFDGRKVTEVVALDDVAGWIEVIVRRPPDFRMVMRQDECGPELERRHGAVRVHWRDS